MMPREVCKINIVPKSKLSSDDWRELGAMLRELQIQERGWLDTLKESQLQIKGISQIETIWPKMTLKDVKDNLKSDNVIIVARDLRSKTIVGFCAIEEKPSLGWATCDELFVKKELRGKKIASMLLKAALQKTKQDGLDSLDLRVSLKNKAAQALYKKLGFSRTAYQMEKWVE